MEPLPGKRKAGLIFVAWAHTQTEAQGYGAVLWMCVWAVTKRETGKNVGQGPNYHLIGSNWAENEQVIKKITCFSLILYHRRRISACTPKKVKGKRYYKLPQKRASANFGATAGGQRLSGFICWEEVVQKNAPQLVPTKHSFRASRELHWLFVLNFIL